MDLIEVIQSVIQRTIKDSDLSDLVTGTVTKVTPLQITEKNVSDPIPAQALLLTEPVIEKKITTLKHSHQISDSYTGGGSCSDALGAVKCYENGKALPADSGYIMLNRGLAVGDKVLMLRVSGGQRYIVLSRVFEGG